MDIWIVVLLVFVLVFALSRGFNVSGSIGDFFKMNARKPETGVNRKINAEVNKSEEITVDQSGPDVNAKIDDSKNVKIHQNNRS